MQPSPLPLAIVGTRVHLAGGVPPTEIFSDASGHRNHPRSPHDLVTGMGLNGQQEPYPLVVECLWASGHAPRPPPPLLTDCIVLSPTPHTMTAELVSHASLYVVLAPLDWARRHAVPVVVGGVTAVLSAPPSTVLAEWPWGADSIHAVPRHAATFYTRARSIAKHPTCAFLVPGASEPCESLPRSLLRVSLAYAIAGNLDAPPALAVRGLFRFSTRLATPFDDSAAGIPVQSPPLPHHGDNEDASSLNSQQQPGRRRSVRIMVLPDVEVWQPESGRLGLADFSVAVEDDGGPSACAWTAMMRSRAMSAAGVAGMPAPGYVVHVPDAFLSSAMYSSSSSSLSATVTTAWDSKQPLFGAQWDASTHTFDGNLAYFDPGCLSIHANGESIVLSVAPTTSQKKPYAAAELRTHALLPPRSVPTAHRTLFWSAATLKASNVSGIVSAFFLYRDPSPIEEIDVVEVTGNMPRSVQLNYFAANVGTAAPAAHGFPQRVQCGWDASVDAHTYATALRPGRAIVWCIDGRPVARAKGRQAQVPEHPTRAMTSVWPSGSGVGWAGAVDADAIARGKAWVQLDLVEVWEEEVGKGDRSRSPFSSVSSTSPSPRSGSTGGKGARSRMKRALGRPFQALAARWRREE